MMNFLKTYGCQNIFQNLLCLNIVLKTTKIDFGTRVMIDEGNYTSIRLMNFLVRKILAPNRYIFRLYN